jgi:two-component system, cell cycle sensor histidine kinase and response regulator CckA
VGEKITRRTRTAEREHARLLRQALKNNAPVFSVGSEIESGSPIPSTPPAVSPELQSAYLEQLIESAPEAISILDTDLRIVRLNGEFTRIFGFSPQEALGQKLEPLIVPPDRSAETRWIQDTLAQGHKVVLETKRKHKDGSLVDVFISSAPVIMSGKHAGICALYRDISEQKRAEALSSALLSIAEKANSAKDLQHFYAATHNIVAELMYARNFYIALYDPLTQLLSFPYFVDEVDPRPTPKKLGKGLTEYVLRTGTPLLCTPEIFEKLVAQGEVELIGAPSLDWLGVPLKVGSNAIGVVVAQSYSGNLRFGEKEKNILTFVSQQLASAVEHKRNEEALRHSEARYRSLIQSAVYGIYRCNLDGKFLDVNHALVTMLGYERAEDVLALNPQAELFADPEELCRLMADFRKGKVNHVEVRWKRKDGKSITVRLSGRAVQTLDEKSGDLEIIAEDVSEQRVLENQFRQAQKMEAVGRLAGGVAHDFNNLLMVISGYAEVLLERTGAQHPLYPKIQAIHQATERATGVTRQLLAFSRKQMLELKVVDVNAIVLDMERLLRPLIGEDVQLQIKLSNDLGHTRADAGQIEQVIMNLVVNSKDAMPAGGKITIQTANVVLASEDVRREYSYIKPGSYVMLSVSDSGHGMDKETQARIFEPFFTTKEKGKGTGLGLSTVYGIIKQSGGYVLVQSELGQGTTFRIYLPRVDEAAEPLDHQPPRTEQNTGSETVLLVEDEESVRQLVRETLESKGYRVLEAENGESALRLSAKLAQPVDALITDVVMPGMSGRELAAQLCASCPKTKVLYLSGYTEDAIVHEGVLESGTAFLQKPFTLHALARKLREVLGGEPTQK